MSILKRICLLAAGFGLLAPMTPDLTRKTNWPALPAKLTVDEWPIPEYPYFAVSSKTE
jgi:hypothetical protein